MSPEQAEQRAFRSPPTVSARRAPQDGQYAAPANMTAKHFGQLTVASDAWQY
jgi:hypothetical protein